MRTLTNAGTRVLHRAHSSIFSPLFSFQEAKVRLRDEKVVFAEKEATITQQVALLSTEFDKRKAVLSNNDAWQKLDSLQQKLRSYAQTVYTLSDYIDSRKRESDYGSLKDRVCLLADEINTMLKGKLLQGQ
jgi:hypothetical protein